MNAFVKKEIRLLLPGWIVVMSLAALLPWLSWKDPDTSFAWMPVFVFFGMILLAVDTFGREFSLGTFPALMSQPMERRQIWRTKITLLFSAAALVFIAFFISSEFLFQHALNIPLWNANQKLINADFRNGMIGCIAAILIALTGGLWTTLLIRQVAAAFWITFLAPLGTLMLIIFFLPAKFPETLITPGLYGLAVIYIVAGFWFAHRLFHRAQDAAWTGGVINFSTWRYFNVGSTNTVSVRPQKPLAALLKKEFQLHSISLFCAGALLVLHVGIFFLRASYTNFHRNSTSFTAIASEFFWTLWLVMPLVIGCMAVAEERKLGVMDSQFCLAVSRRRQFAIKFFPAMIFGVLLGGVMPLLLETIAAYFSNPTDLFKSVYGQNATGNFSFLPDNFVFYLAVIALSPGLTLIGFFASTLARNFMQALSITIVGIVICVVFWTFITGHMFSNNGTTGFIGMRFWGGLPILIGLLTIITFIPWLAWRNFNHFTESGRLWRRNVFGIAGALLFVFASSALIYNRVWEFAEPAEPAHGAAKISLLNPPKLQSDYSGNLQVQFVNGRIWFDSLDRFGYWEADKDWQRFWRVIVERRTISAGPEQFIAGDHWISAASLGRIDWWNGRERISGYRDAAGIQADGSLWLSSAAKPAIWGGTNMLRFGKENDWRQVVGIYGRYFLLLKTDGTLWAWGSKKSDLDSQSANWPGVREYQPQQLGTNTDWQELFLIWGGYAKKNDGHVWHIDFEGKPDEVKYVLRTNLDRIMPQTLDVNSGESDYSEMAYIGTNGTVWTRNIRWEEDTEQSRDDGFLQVGTETNWLAVAINDSRLVALKPDGSLWQWKLDFKSAADSTKNPPVRFGIHNDWVGLTSAPGGIISLAADGNLWFWPGPAYDGLLLKATRKPQLLANIFGKDN